MKKKILSLFLFLCLSLVTFTNVYALKVGEAGDNVNQDGNYDSTRFIAGNRVYNNAHVDGISFVAGNQVTLEGSATYGAYAGNSLNVKEKIEKDLFLAGNIITIYEEAFVTRDAYIAGNNVRIKGTIGRNLNVGASTVNLSGAKINGDAYILADMIVLDEKTVIEGKLTYSDDTSISGLDKATISSVKTKNFKTEKVVTYNVMDSIYVFLLSAIAAFIVMMVLFYIIPRSKEKLDDLKYDGSTIFKTLVIGLAVLFFTPIVALFALITGFLIPLSLIVLAVYLVSIYLATLLSSYVVGNLITTKLIKKDNIYLALVIGILLIKVLILLPFLGVFVGIIALLYGLGLIFDFIASRGR